MKKLIKLLSLLGYIGGGVAFAQTFPGGPFKQNSDGSLDIGSVTSEGAEGVGVTAVNGFINAQAASGVSITALNGNLRGIALGSSKYFYLSSAVTVGDPLQAYIDGTHNYAQFGAGSSYIEINGNASARWNSDEDIYLQPDRDINLNAVRNMNVSVGGDMGVSVSGNRLDSFGSGYYWDIVPDGGLSSSEWFDNGDTAYYDHETGDSGLYFENAYGFFAFGAGSNLELLKDGPARLYGQDGTVHFNSNVLKEVGDAVDSTDVLNVRTADGRYANTQTGVFKKVNIGHPYDTSASLNVSDSNVDGSKVRVSVQGGNAPTIYDPSTIFGANLLAWWKTQDLSGSDGDPVSVLTDSSGNGYDLETEGSHNPPLLATDPASGNRVLNFSGGEKDLRNASIPIPNYPFSIITIVRPILPFGYVNAIYSNYTRDVGLMGPQSTDAPYFGFFDLSDPYTVTSAVNPNQNYFVSQRYQTTTSRLIYLNSDAPVTSTATASQFGAGIVLGHLITDDGIYGGYIGESFIVDRDLTDDEVKKVNDYAKYTWGIDAMVYQGDLTPQTADLEQWTNAGVTVALMDANGGLQVSSVNGAVSQNLDIISNIHLNVLAQRDINFTSGLGGVSGDLALYGFNANDGFFTNGEKNASMFAYTGGGYLYYALDGDNNKFLFTPADGSSVIDAGGMHITGLADPTNPRDAATKAYVDTAEFDTGSLWEEADGNVELTSPATLIMNDKPIKELSAGVTDTDATNLGQVTALINASVHSGIVTMSGGSVVVTDGAITSTSVLTASPDAIGTNIGWLAVGYGSGSATITSTNILEAGPIRYILKP